MGWCSVTSLTRGSTPTDHRKVPSASLSSSLLEVGVLGPVMMDRTVGALCSGRSWYGYTSVLEPAHVLLVGLDAEVGIRFLPVLGQNHGVWVSGLPAGERPVCTSLCRDPTRCSPPEVGEGRKQK